MSKVTSIDIARQLGVSPATVSLALKGDQRVSEETRKKVKELAEKLNYTPNPLALSLRTKRTKIIGLIIPSIINPFYPAIAWGVDYAAVEAGYTVFLCNTYRDIRRENEQFFALIGRQVDGIIYFSITKNTQEMAYLEDLKQSGIKCICLNRKSYIPWIDSISTDSLTGGYLATKHLIDLGHRRIAYIGIEATNRRIGYEKALKEAGISIAPELEQQLPIIDEHGDEPAYEVTRRLMRDHPDITAIFAYNDMSALGAYRAIKERGLIIPKAVSVVGYDDFPFAKSADPPLTTVWQPTYEIGVKAVEILVEKINNNQETDKSEILLAPKLVVRSSTGPNPNI